MHFETLRKLTEMLGIKYRSEIENPSIGDVCNEFVALD